MLWSDKNMTSKFSAFMAQNVARIENKKIVVSNRFKDENGKPIEWEIRALTNEENDELQRRAMVNVPVMGQRGAFTRELDNVKYSAMLLAASVVYPDLNDAELQDSYGVKTPEALINKMLYMREATVLAQEIAKLSNFDNLPEAVTEAKN